jgi:hypothetical protein
MVMLRRKFHILPFVHYESKYLEHFLEECCLFRVALDGQFRLSGSAKRCVLAGYLDAPAPILAILTASTPRSAGSAMSLPSLSRAGTN